MKRIGIAITGFIIIMLMILELAISQSIDRRFHHLTIRDGLSQSRIEAIHQDSQGYLWIGTTNGLNRYDGYDFTVYRSVTDDPGSLSDSYINVIYEDSEGTLWIGTFTGGLMRYEPETDSFRSYIGIFDESGWSTLSANMVLSILEDSRGNFWVGTVYGLNIMNRESGTFRRLTPENEEEPTPSDTYINELYEDSDGTLWIGTSNGLEYYDYESAEFYRFRGFEDGDAEPDFGTIRAITEDKNGILWVGTDNNGLYAIDTKREILTNYLYDPDNPNSLSGNAIFSIHEVSSGELWIGTGNDGLNIFDHETGIFHRYVDDRLNPFSINNNGITQIYESREGIIWVGTNDSGLNYHALDGQVFQSFQNEPFNPNSLSHNVVRSIREMGPNEIWIGTDGGGLNIFDPVSRSFTNSVNNPTSRNFPASEVILDIHKRDSEVYLATYGNGVEIYDMVNGSIRNLSDILDEPEHFGSPFVFDIFESRDGHLWFSKNVSGVTEYNPETGEFKRYEMNSNGDSDSIILQNGDARAVYEDHQGTIWIATYGSFLHKLDRTSGEIEILNINRSSPNFASVVHTIYEDSNDRLWFGTSGGGLKYYDSEQNILVDAAHYDNYLPSNVVHLIMEDRNGNLWISTNNGITQLNRDTDEYITYDLEQGLSYTEFNPRSGEVMSDGSLYFGSTEGFLRFYPENIRSDSSVIPVVLTELLLYNEPVYPGENSPLEKEINVAEKVVLPYTTRMITIGYSAINFSPTKTNQYEYRLLGFEDEWNLVGNQNRATFTNLQPGEYEFQVRSSNNSGIWSDEYRSLTIVIVPPFWDSLWFILLVVIFITAVVWGTFWYRIRLIRLEKVKLERTIRDRTKELRKSNETKDRLFSIIAHDLRNYAGNILGLTELLIESSSNKNLEEIEEYTDILKSTAVQFDDFLKNLLDWARYQTDVIKYEPKLFKPKDVLRQIMDQAEPNARNKKIELILDIDGEIEVFADPNLFAIVMFNLLSNAAKFSYPESEIKVTVKKLSSNKVEISVSDHGMGMTEESIQKLLTGEKRFTKTGTAGEKGTGIGFDLCRDFITRNGGRLSIESELEKGTNIRFTLPTNEKSTREIENGES